MIAGGGIAARAIGKHDRIRRGDGDVRFCFGAQVELNLFAEIAQGIAHHALIDGELVEQGAGAIGTFLQKILQGATMRPREHTVDVLHTTVHPVVRLVAEAEDCAQEAFIQAWSKLDKFRGDSAFYTWLYRIAINTAKNHLVAMKLPRVALLQPAGAGNLFEGGDEFRAAVRIARIIHRVHADEDIVGA